MARNKEIRRRIKSVDNTRKITRTMQMVATSRMMKALERLNGAKPFTAKLRDVMSQLAAAAPDAHPLLQARDTIRATAVFLVTANRGLCGAFNANLVKQAREVLAAEKQAGHGVVVHVAGKKGIQALKFARQELASSYLDVTERPRYEDAVRLAKMLIDAYQEGVVDRVVLIHANYKNALSQPPVVVEFLPIPRAEARTEGRGVDYLFHPSREELVRKLVPLYLENLVYQALVESAASEHVARRNAMKSATENAEELVGSLTRAYNKARQAQITNEIAEIVGGAAAQK
jgi:F-type H+-transporting ATPase subunit gamma